MEHTWKETDGEAWRVLRRNRTADLVLAGRRRADAPSTGEQPGLRVLGEVPDRDLPALYSGAVATIYPSLYEGFGIPVLEAMQCGCPVIASRDPAIVEVSGGAAIHVDAQDTRGLAAAMERLLCEPAERNSRREKGMQRVSWFTWSRTAKATREVYAEAIRRFSGGDPRRNIHESAYRGLSANS